MFDVSPDGNLAVTLRNDPALSHPALLTSFHPVLGTEYDNKTFGFGPLGVQMAQTANGLRVVVLTSEGGPRRIYLFGLSPAGILTQLASTQLTTSGADAGSNIVLSGSSQTGFAVVVSGTGGSELVTFSLVDGAVLNRLPVSGEGTLAMTESASQRTLVFLKDISTLTVVDATNPVMPAVRGDVSLPRNSEFSGDPAAGLGFSADSRYAFVGNQFVNLTAIDLSTLQAISSISGDYRFGRVSIFEDAQRRVLAVQSTPAGTGGQAAILLIDATDPMHLSIINQLNAGSGDLVLSSNGSRLFVQTNQRLIAYDLPTFTEAWHKDLVSSGIDNQLTLYGDDELLATWMVSGGLGFVSLFGAFPGNPPNISLNDVTVNEGDTAAVNANFSILLSAATTHRVTVSYATVNGSAIQDADFTTTSGSLVFEPGETTKMVSVPVRGDTLDEFDESFGLNLLDATVGIITRTQGTGTILDDDEPPSVSIADASIVEGNAGTGNLDITVSLSAASGKEIALNYATADGTATAENDYVGVSGSLTFAVGQLTRNISVPILTDPTQEPDETFLVNLTNPQNVVLARAQATGTIIDDDAPAFRFTTGNSTVSENSGSAIITVIRGGDSSSAVAVDYATSDASGASNCDVVSGVSSSRCDYLATLGTLRFAINETTKMILIPIIDDAYAEGSENFTITLSNSTGAILGSPSTATITISDDESTNGPNPLDQANFLARQHYVDFLNREPDAAGLGFWSDQITSCATDTACVELRRINVSAAFFLSIEFQQTGYLVYRIYKAAYGNLPNAPVPVTLNEFLPDTQEIGRGVVVGQAGWENVLENNKQVFALNFAARSRFTMAHPTTLTPAQFVDELFTNAGVTPSSNERDAAINEFSVLPGDTADLSARARALRRVAENSILFQQETNGAFVLMQYFGYLRRNPNDAPDSNFDGYNFWLGKLNQFNGNFVNAEMVKAFILSGEYRQRFGP